MEKSIKIPRDAIAALIINAKNLCGEFPYTSIKECVYFEREFKDIFLHNEIVSYFNEKIDNVLFDVSDNGFITPRNNNYDTMLINFLNASDEEVREILNSYSIIIGILIRFIEKDKFELLKLRKQMLELENARKPHLH